MRLKFTEIHAGLAADGVLATPRSDREFRRDLSCAALFRRALARGDQP
jgi:hypothetical protein